MLLVFGLRFGSLFGLTSNGILFGGDDARIEARSLKIEA
jgi:hypothetical protein